MTDLWRLTAREAVALLRDRKRTGEIAERCVEINRLENEGDQLYRAALEKLFESATDAIDAKYQQRGPATKTEPIAPGEEIAP